MPATADAPSPAPTPPGRTRHAIDATSSIPDAPEARTHGSDAVIDEFAGPSGPARPKSVAVDGRRAIDNGLDAVLLLDRNGTVRYANNAAALLFGRPVEHLLGSPLGLPVGNGDAGDVADLDQLQIARPDATVRDAEFRSVPDATSDGFTLVTLRDVTERNMLQLRLRQAEKMEAVGRLAGGVAHDFNNMLTAVVGYASLAEQRLDAARRGGISTGDIVRVRGDLEEVRRAAEAAQALTRQLLSFSSRHRPPAGDCDLAQVLRSHSRIYEAACGGMLRLDLDIDPDLPRVAADEDMVDRLLLNLAVNSRDAVVAARVQQGTAAQRSPDADDAVLHVIARRAAGPIRDVAATAESVTVSGESSDHAAADAHVELRIIDHGPGVPPEIRPHLFEPFFTTKADGLGSGLGLSTVYGIVSRCGGRIELVETAGGGATFVIRLPARLSASQSTPATPPDAPAAPAPDAESHQPRILLVEDQHVIRKLLARVLKKEGFAVQSAADGQQAVELIEAAAAGSRDGFDLVASDVAMPGMTGIEVAHRAKLLMPTVPVLLMSGYTNGDLHTAGSGGADDDGLADVEYDFLQKPFEPDDLVGRIRHLLRQSA